MQVRREQADALEPKALGYSEGDREREQDEEVPVRSAHNEPPEPRREEQLEVGAHPGIEENVRNLGHQASSPASGDPASPRSTCPLALQDLPISCSCIFWRTKSLLIVTLL